MKLLCMLIYYISLLKFFKLESIQASLKNELPGLVNNKNEVIDRAVMIIQQCFTDKSKGLMVSPDIADPNNDKHYLLRALHFSIRPLSLIGFQSSNPYLFSKPNPAIVYPAIYFVLLLSLETHENELLYRVRKSMWWNHEGTFIIVAMRGCNKAATMLHMLWTFNVLSGMLLCCDENDQRMRLYVHNPFSEYAPEFWKVAERNVDEVSEHPWTLFEHALMEQDYMQASRICENLIFLTTTNLHGYPVRIAASLHTMIYLNSENKTILSNIVGEHGDIARTLWTHLNATPKLQFYANFLYDNRTKNQGVFKDLDENRVDYGLHMMFLRQFWKRQTYPFDVNGICAVTKMERISAIEKFLAVFNFHSCFAIAGLCIIALFILKFLMTKKSWQTCSLDVARMVVGMSSLSQPRNTKKFFAIILLSTMYANFFLQYLISSLYMLPNFGSVIDTLDDLVASNLPIYGYSNYREFFVAYGNLNHRYRDNKDVWKCLARLNHGEDIICLYSCKVHNITNNKLIRVAKQSMRDLYLTFTMREDWPLASRVNKVLARMGEAGLLRLFRSRNKHRYQKLVQEKEKWRSMNLSTALPTFLGFAWSIAFATCVFLGEVGTYRGLRIGRRFFSNST